MTCVGPGRESRRCRFVSSSDDSGFAPLVSRPVVATTQWDRGSVDASDDECLVRPNVGRDVSARTAQSDDQVRPTLMDGAFPNCLGRGRDGVRSELPTPTRRRRLVVEVAPSVVDVFAVALPGSPLFVTNVESDGEGVPAFHPWDSDEEDGLDTHPPVPEDVVNGLESDLVAEGDRSAKENTPVVSTVPAISGAFRRRLLLVGGGRRVVLVPQSVGTPKSDQDVFDADEESQAAVDHFDMTVADSSAEVTPRHQLRVGSTQPTRFDSPSANRFATLRDDDAEVHEEACVSTISDLSSVVGEPRVRRRLSLVWDGNHRPQSFMDVEKDPESIHLEEEGSDGFASERGLSEPDEEKQELDGPPPTGVALELDVRARNVAIGMASLDEFHLPEIFKHRARVMRSVPLFLKGAFRGAMRVAFEEAQFARDTNDATRNSRAWKLFMLFPRMLLSRPPRGGQVPKKQLEERFSMFSAGQWAELIRGSLALSATRPQAAIRRRRKRNHDDVQKRADKAMQLVQMGELSAGRLALDGALVAGGDGATLKAFTDQKRRPAMPRAPLSQSILEAQPEVFSLDEGLFVQSLRSSRRGAAAGPSGMTADHLQPLLDTARDTSLLYRFATVLARGQAPDAAVEGVRMGRITALQKPDGGVRGIVVGNVLRRLVAKAMAKQMAAKVEAAISPFQYALATKAGCESVAHISQSLTYQDERATIVSIDGVVAYDLISRNAMLEGIVSVPEGDRLLPFVRHFHGSPSTYLWED